MTNRPTAPVLWYEREGIVLALPMLSCSVLAEIHVTTAFVQMDIKFQNTSGHTVRFRDLLSQKDRCAICFSMSRHCYISCSYHWKGKGSDDRIYSE